MWKNEWEFLESTVSFTLEPSWARERKRNAKGYPYLCFLPLRTPNNFLKSGANMAGGRTTTIFTFIPAFPFSYHSMLCKNAPNGAFFVATADPVIENMKKK